MTWRQIETGPKFQHVLVWDGREVNQSCWGKVSHVSFYGWLNVFRGPENTDLMDPQPTHWMPLPEPPEATP